MRSPAPSPARSGRRSRAVAVALVVLAAAACDSSGADDAAGTSAPGTAVDTSIPVVAAEFRVRPGTEQIAVLGAEPGDSLAVVRDGVSVATGEVDEEGSLLFRQLEPGDGYVVQVVPDGSVDEPVEQSDVVTVLDAAFVPPQELYAEQQTLLPAGGFGYITTRDGTTLSANVILPGPPEDGPYPTVVEYSGYSPSNPDDAALAQLYTVQGFAYVGVNMRGTGCSGGSFRFFELTQSIDGYDVIEAVAAQPWVLNNRVGMVGISYPGISQLFVAATQPPSLAAITPLSVIADTYRSNLYPGGILNTGFAVDWTKSRVEQAKPYGQQWTRDRADGGDLECANNQLLRLQNPDLVAEIGSTPFYDDELGDSLSPRTFVDDITVPVFLAGAWQDEQTGADFATMIPLFTGTDHLYVDLVNGLHTEALSPRILARSLEFLQLYIAERVPDISFANALGPVLGSAIWGVTSFLPFENRFAGMAYDDALAAFEAEPAVRVLFDQGGRTDLAAGSPEPAHIASFDRWPLPEASARSWWLGPDGTLLDAPLPGGTAVEVSYVADPDALPATFYPGGGSSDIWRADTQYDWRPLPDGTGVGFASAPLVDDMAIVGSAAVELWVSATSPDTDLEVTVTEIRPDGTEIYVQSGWLRASHRALAPDDPNANVLRAVHTHAEGDAEPLPAGEFSAVRIEILPFAHVFRAGSRLRLTVDAPGNNRPVWAFDTISAGETVTLAADDVRAARLILSWLPAFDVDWAAPAACGALRGQPCRVYGPALNGG
ncbi:MAG: CocE/NonD family hydrolase [Ilumatobacteraceae bacterium]